MFKYGIYPVYEHTEMAERETSFEFTAEGGAATIDAAPGLIETLPFTEFKYEGDSFEVLIVYGNLGRRYKGKIEDGKASGTMIFEGGMEGVVVEFDTVKRELPEGAGPGGPPPGGPGGPPPGGPGGPPPMQ